MQVCAFHFLSHRPPNVLSETSCSFKYSHYYAAIKKKKNLIVELHDYTR
uniref:Uncharacterized protein n=1 Tax=Anguilla anguilla TaxID=7936 RepID=A0A0E9S1Q6_ANGAN